jgi:adenylate kinase
VKLVILGGPGAGKGTQAQPLCRHLGISEISTSNILREAIASASELGRQAKIYLEKGELVPDQILIEFMRTRLIQPDTAQGWLLEGYPRTAFQAEELDFLLDDLGQQLNWAIYLKVTDEVMRSRCLEREPHSNGIASRLDDQPEIIQRRINLFYEHTLPMLEYYEYRQRLLTINADQSPQQVQQEILQKLHS